MSNASRQAALEGRMPVLDGERIFASPLPFMWSCTVFCAGIWIFMVGIGLAGLGDVRITCAGYLIGLVIGFGPSLLAGGMPSFRYGIDTIDASKATFGARGATLPLLGLLYVSLAWSAVVLAFIVHSGALVMADMRSEASSVSGADMLTTVLVFTVVGLAWLMLFRGPAFMERVNNLLGPVLLLAIVVLGVALWLRFADGRPWSLAPAQVTFPDRKMALVSSIELGVGTSMGLWPCLGGLTRLVARERNLYTPGLLGTNIIGMGAGAVVAAFVTVLTGQTEPVRWFTELCGPRLGTVILVLLVLVNIGTIGLLVYFAAVSVQMYRVLRRIPWGVLAAVLLLPAVVAGFNAEATLSSVLAIVNYQGMLLVGMGGTLLGSYYFVLRQRIQVRGVFSAEPRGPYHFHHGVNWRAIASSAIGSLVYWLLYDPVTLAAPPAFLVAGASLPAIVASCGAYVLLMRGVMSRGQVASDQAEQPLTVDL